jgi:hypothetical protein
MVKISQNAAPEDTIKILGHEYVIKNVKKNSAGRTVFWIREKGHDENGFMIDESGRELPDEEIEAIREASTEIEAPRSEKVARAVQALMASTPAKDQIALPDPPRVVMLDSGSASHVFRYDEESMTDIVKVKTDITLTGVNEGSKSKLTHCGTFVKILPVLLGPNVSSDLLSWSLLSDEGKIEVDHENKEFWYHHDPSDTDWRFVTTQDRTNKLVQITNAKGELIWPQL